MLWSVESSRTKMLGTLKQQCPRGKWAILNSAKCLFSSQAIMNRYMHKIEMKENNALREWTFSFDGKPIKSPSNNEIVLDSPLLGKLLHEEWCASGSAKGNAVTSLVYRALDLKHDKELRGQVIEELLRYVHTDSLCYLSSLEEVAAEQKSIWIPILEKLKSDLNLSHPIRTSTSIQIAGQNEENVAVFKSILENQISPMQLAGFEHLVRLFKSFLLPMALFRGLITVQEANAAANTEASIQSNKWGSIEDVHEFSTSKSLVECSLANVLLTSTKKEIYQ